MTFAQMTISHKSKREEEEVILVRDSMHTYKTATTMML